MAAKYLDPVAIGAEISSVVTPIAALLNAIPGSYGTATAALLTKLDNPIYLTAAIEAINTLDGAIPQSPTSGVAKSF